MYLDIYEFLRIPSIQGINSNVKPLMGKKHIIVGLIKYLNVKR